jgi:hypothetical protein
MMFGKPDAVEPGAVAENRQVPHIIQDVAIWAYMIGVTRIAEVSDLHVYLPSGLLSPSPLRTCCGRAASLPPRFTL